MRSQITRLCSSIKVHVFGILLVVLFLAGTIISSAVFHYAITKSADAQEYGPWGDFIGGTLNPILTFLTFSGVLLSIFLQRLELSLTRNELERSADALEKQISSIEKQNFEVAFFQMLGTFNEIVGSIDLHNKENGVISNGRDCFRIFYTRLNKIYRENKGKSKSHHSPESVLRLSYFTFWKEHQLELGHYYRFLYNVFRFLDENSASQDYHAKLLRAQLSDQELLLLFYNCQMEQGRNFVTYAVKYELFDNLPTVRLLENGHAALIDRRAFGSNPMYNSKNIRSSF